MRAYERFNKWSVVAMGLVVALPAAAQESVPQVYFEMESIQRAPMTFNFQARVTQAKMGLEDAETDITVELLSGEQPLCSETFNDVRIRNSLLNLTIGTQCALDVHLARYTDIDLKVCFKKANCLKAIKLGSVPFALKANMAVQAQYAPRADYAARSFIAHRISADRRLAGRSETGKGYFDFYSSHQLSALSNTAYVPSVHDGFVQWAPVSTDDPTQVNRLNICSLANDIPTTLDEFVVYAEDAKFSGNLHVAGQTMSIGNGAELEEFTIAAGQSTLAVNAKHTNLAEGDLTVNGLLVQGGPTPTMQSSSDLLLSVPNVNTTGNVTVGGELTSTGPLTVLSSDEPSVFSGSVEIRGNLTVAAGGSVQAEFPEGSITGGVGGDIDDETIDSYNIKDGSIGSVDVGFSWARGVTAGGDAAGLACSGCVQGSGTEAGASASHIASGTISEGDLSFNAAYGTETGAAMDLHCPSNPGCNDGSDACAPVPGCVDGSDINKDEVQARISDSCSGGRSFMVGVDKEGIPQCQPVTTMVAVGGAALRESTGSITFCVPDSAWGWVTCDASGVTCPHGFVKKEVISIDLGDYTDTLYVCKVSL